MRAAAIGVVLFAATPALAFTIHSPVSEGCHESITEDALRRVRQDGLAEALAPKNDDERALLDDLPFDLPSDLDDLGAAAILIGVRRPDIRENSNIDVSALALVHGDPNHQSDHCLRGPDNDEPNGTPSAIEACREVARGYLERASQGLLADGTVNSAAYDTVELTLPIRGNVDVKLNSFYVNIGTALHQLQDAFSHTYRDDDVDRIVSALNWVDYVEERGVEERDGPEHSSELDACKKLDARQQLRLERATNASIELLAAMLTNDPATRVTTAAAVFQRATESNTSCTFDNQWCATADSSYAKSATCAQLGESSWLMVASMIAVVWRGRRRR